MNQLFFFENQTDESESQSCGRFIGPIQIMREIRFDYLIVLTAGQKAVCFSEVNFAFNLSLLFLFLGVHEARSPASLTSRFFLFLEFPSGFKSAAGVGGSGGSAQL